jgi:hypothetical protein
MNSQYEKVGRHYALSGKKKEDVDKDVKDIFSTTKRDKAKEDIDKVIALYDDMLDENQKKIDEITVSIKANENKTDRSLCTDGILVTMRELLVGLSMILINIICATIIIEREIALPGINKYTIAILSPVLMVFLSYVSSNFLVKEWRKISRKTFGNILAFYLGSCFVLIILLRHNVKYVDYLLYLTSLIYPIYLLARIFMVSSLVEKKGHLTELMSLRNEIKKGKSDAIAEISEKLSKAIEEDLKNERDFWLGYASGNSITK